MRLLGIDFGAKHIGLAIGDDASRIASPIGSIAAGGAMDALRDIVRKEDIDAFVVGLPQSAGSFHSDEQLKATQTFIESLKATFGKEVFTEDERYTSVESQRLQEEAGVNNDEHALAAMLILQAFLDHA